MAEHKKSFILYADIIHTVKKMPKGKQADLFMTILKYVNDENPVVDDLIVGLVWEPIKLQLKRDLKYWEDQRAKRVEAGKLGGLKSGEARKSEAETKQNEATPSNASKNEANEAVNVTVNVNDTVIDNKNKNHDFVCYDAEGFILNNRQLFEKICIATGKDEPETKKHIHAYHLWMTKNEKYPVGKRAVAAGAESWILNAKNFKSNLDITKTQINGRSNPKNAGRDQLLASLKETG